MKIFVTQRIDLFGNYNERRDSIDLKWYEFFENIGITPILVPNNLEMAQDLFSTVNCSGLLLTGGNTLAHLDGGDAPERDEVERFLLREFLQKKMPVIGVCRGFHMIQHYFGGPIEKINGYSNALHTCDFTDQTSRRVTTHCNYGFYKTPLTISGIDENGVIMSLENKSKNIYGQLWHPERDVNKSEQDVKKFKIIFGVNE